MSYRYFTSYTGVKLPAKLIGEIAEADLKNRNTFIRAQFDDQDRVLVFEQMVYGEIQLYHRYEYNPNGSISEADIHTGDEDEMVSVSFDQNGDRL